MPSSIGTMILAIVTGRCRRSTCAEGNVVSAPGGSFTMQEIPQVQYLDSGRELSRSLKNRLQGPDVFGRRTGFNNDFIDNLKTICGVFNTDMRISIIKVLLFTHERRACDQFVVNTVKMERPDIMKKVRQREHGQSCLRCKHCKILVAGMGMWT